MKRLRISHLTEYEYIEPVIFGPHRILVRPREGHDVHIESSRLEIEPDATVKWLRDIYGNSIAILTFFASGARLRVLSEVVVNHYDENPLDFTVDTEAAAYPFQYPVDEHAELIPYRFPSYPRDAAPIREWLVQFYKPGQLIGTLDLLSALNTAINRSFVYLQRDESGVQRPAETLAQQSGSCRDFATLMMDATRHWGFGARFVTGYLQTPPDEAQHGATHAWTEIYIPGAGWRGFDPTNDTFAGADHVSVAVARDPEKASPISGSWTGLSGAFQRMNVHVDVVQL
jgi:transglutaminase-like putative cysteine protease